MKTEWKKPHEKALNVILDDDNGKVFISYNPNDFVNSLGYDSLGRDLDSAKPETAIVLIGDKKDGRNRYLIFRGDRREELEKLYPNIEKLKEYWKEDGGHFWSDSLDN